MYKAGYVLIGLDDIVIKTAEYGRYRDSLQKNTALMLPGRKEASAHVGRRSDYYHFMGENGIQGYARISWCWTLTER